MSDNFRKVVLDKLNFAVEKRWPKYWQRNAVRADFEIDFATEELLAKIVYTVAGEHVKSLQISYPATWWEAVWDRFAPLWAKKHWPTNWTTQVLDAFVIYPLVSLPQEHHKIVFMKNGMFP